MSTITKLSPEVIQYYMNITSLICAIARLQRDVQVWIVQKEAQSPNRKTLEPNKGAWKDGASDGLLEIHVTAAPLWSATGRIHMLQAPKPGHEDPEDSELPRRVVRQKPDGVQDKYKCIDKTES